MSDNIQLTASKRHVTGKKVNQLRVQGLIPGVLYGPTNEPVNLQFPARELMVTLAKAGGSQIIDLNIDGEASPALVRDVQRDTLRDTLLHVDFYAVSMDRAITAEIPLDFVNEPGVESTDVILVTSITTVEIECLPGDLPASIPVDLSALVDMDSNITVADLEAPEGVTILVAPEEMIATLNYAAAEEEEEEELEEVDAEAVEVIGRDEEEEAFEED